MFKLISLKSHWPKILSILLFFLLIGAYTQIFAIGEPYDPGETLDPECPPGEVNCTVLITSGGSVVYPDTGIPVSTSLAWGTSINSSSGLATNISDEVGTGYLVLNDSPSFTTRITTPLVSGGTGTTTDLSFQTTSGVGNNGADMHFLVGNNGSTEAMTILNNGNVGIGTNSPTRKLTVVSTDFDVASFRRTTSGGGGTINFINGNNQTWGFGSGGNFNEFFISDRDSLTFPFRIEETTPNDSFYIKNNGNIGIGTGTPDSKLEIKLSSTTNYSQSFTGSGLDDAIFSGSYILPDPLYYPPAITNRIYVEILEPEAEGDSAHVYDEIASCDLYYVITDYPTLICNGIYISFYDTFGHNPGDVWIYEISSYYLNQKVLSVNDGVSNYFTVNAGAVNSNFLGDQAGEEAYLATHSNFLGYQSGYQATSAYYSNFLGFESGYQATNAHDSNYMGTSSGYGAINSFGSNFFGARAGYQATSASYSNFLGPSAGRFATGASYSNFFGVYAGFSALEAKESNFFGSNAGDSAFKASNSIFIGRLAGYWDTVDNTGNADDFSILIGKSTNTGGFSNSIALGGSAVNTASNEFMIGSTTRPINTTVWTGASGTATLDTATGLITTSDERLKKNITDLEDTTLDKLINVRTVKYNWINGDSDKTNIGFLAQDLENYFPELVYTGTDDYKGVNYANMTPILVEAIREMDLKVKNINDFEIENDWRENIITWIGNTANGITEFVAGIVRAKDKLCIGEGEDEVCITKEELLQIKINSKIVEEDQIIIPDPIISVDPVDDIIVVEEKKQDEKVDSLTEEQEEISSELIDKENELIDELSEDQNNQGNEAEDPESIGDEDSSDIMI